VEKSVGLL